MGLRFPADGTRSGPRLVSTVAGLHCTYRQCAKMFTENLAGLTADDIALVMGDALKTWLDWSV
jgi:hypothetical protein